MLTHITPQTNVNTANEVVAVTSSNTIANGFLVYDKGKWNCITKHGIVRDITHYITVTNLLRGK
jgi:hypothetical protein